jgi:MFS family permease
MTDPAAAGVAGPRFVERATLPITLLVQAAASAAVLAPTVAAPKLIEALHGSAALVGLYMAVVYVGATLSSQWGAPLVKRWGPMRTSQVALAVCAVGVMLVGVPQLGLAALGAFLLGIGYGPITPASSEMLARTTPPERYAFVFSVKQTGVPLGGAVAGLIVPVVLDAFGTGWALAQVSVLCVLGVMLAEILRSELDALRDRTSPLPTLAGMAQPLRLVVSHGVLRRLAACTFIFSAVQVSLTSYLVSFLHSDLRWTLVAAGVALSIAQAGGVAGRILWGVVADRWWGERQTLLGLSAVMALAGLAMLLLRPGAPPLAAWLLFAVYGATAIGWNGVFLATVARLVPREQAAMATSGSLFFTFFGVVIGPPLFGLVGSASTLGIAFAALALPLAWVVFSLSRGDWNAADASHAA